MRDCNLEDKNRKLTHDLTMKLTQDKIANFISELKKHTDYDFSEYSQKSFRRRIEKVLGDYHLNIDELTSRVLENESFMERIVREITVNTTELFRDPNTWKDIIDYIKQYLINKPEIRIWSAGCSNGLEIYSLVIMLNEMGLLDRVRIYGSDLNSDMIARAKKGEYPNRNDNEFFDGYQTVMQTGVWNVPLDKYFVYNPKEYKVNVRPEYTNVAKYQKHNLVQMENPFHVSYDLILCRNVLIYFTHDLQEKIFHFFHRHLTTNGALILGVHEGMLGPVSEKYFKVGQIYMKNSYV